MAAYGAAQVIWIGASFAAGAGTIWLRRKGGWIAVVLLVLTGCGKIQPNGQRKSKQNRQVGLGGT